MTSNKFGNILQILHNRHDVGELAHIDILALCVVDHGGQKYIRQSDKIAKAILAFGQFDLLLEGREAACDHPLRPWLPLVLAESGADFLEHSKVLYRLGSCVDHLAQTSNLEPLHLVLGKKLSLVRIGLFKVLTDSHGLCQGNGFLGDILILYDQGWDHLKNVIKEKYKECLPRCAFEFCAKSSVSSRVIFIN